MCRVPFAKYAPNHNPQQDEVFNKVDHNTPLVFSRLEDVTCAELGGPLCLTLNNAWYQRWGDMGGMEERRPVLWLQVNGSELLANWTKW